MTVHVRPPPPSGSASGRDTGIQVWVEEPHPIESTGVRDGETATRGEPRKRDLRVAVIDVEHDVTGSGAER